MTDPAPPSLDEQRWQLVLGREATHDRQFVYAVQTTGSSCRPSCPSRRPKRSNGALTAAYEDLIGRLRPLVRQGLSAAVYTQMTDVEREINGLLTCDRSFLMMDRRRVRAANDRLLREAINAQQQ